VLVVNAEHGGQVLRVGAALAAVFGKPVKFVKIRARRPNPGLRNQHISAVRAVARFCNGEVKGLEVGSMELEFYPGELEKRKLKIDVGTAGSVSLVLQAASLPACLKGGEIVVRGGTDVPFAPPVDYLRLVTFPTLGKFGFKARIEVKKRGYYPRGGGEIAASFSPSRMTRIEVLSPEKTQFRGISHATNLPGVARRMKISALKVLSGKVDVKIEVNEIEDEPWKKGCAIVIGGFGRGGSALGERGKRAELVGMEAANELLASLNLPLDRYMSDQILPFVALFGGRVRVVETGHVLALTKLFRELNIPFSYQDSIFEAPGVL